MSTVESASLIRTASFIQKFGFTAARPAATRPATGPAAARASRAIATIATVPITTIVSRWARMLSVKTAVGPSTRTVRGGWSAAGCPLIGMTNQLPLARLNGDEVVEVRVALVEQLRVVRLDEREDEAPEEPGRRDRDEADSEPARGALSRSRHPGGPGSLRTRRGGRPARPARCHPGPVRRSSMPASSGPTPSAVSWYSSSTFTAQTSWCGAGADVLDGEHRREHRVVLVVVPVHAVAADGVHVRACSPRASSRSTSTLAR